MADIPVLYRQAVAAFEAGQPDEANVLANQVLALAPDHLEALMISGTASVQVGEPEFGLSQLRKAVDLAPEHAETHYNLAKGYIALEIWDQAERALIAAIAANREFLSAQFDLAILLEKQGRPREAELRYREVLDIDPGVADAWLGLGNVQRGQGRLEDAADSYRQANTLSSGTLPAYNNLGNVLLELERFEEAESLYREAIDRSPGRANYWYNLGNLLRRWKKPGPAVEAFDKALSLDPYDKGMRINRGHALREAGRVDGAIEAFSLLAADYPDTGHIHSLLASALTQGGDFEAASLVCDDFLAAHPANPSILSYKAIVWNEEGRDQEVSAFLDFDRLVVPVRVQVPEGFDDMDAFNRALEEHIQNHPSLVFAPGDNATRSGFHSGDLLVEPKGPIADLEAQILQAVESYRRDFEIDATHPFFSQPPPERLRLLVWSVVLRSQGYQIPHIHPDAWLSGVYYAKVPSFIGAQGSGDDGCIEFGEPNDQLFFARPPPVGCFRPEEGKLFLFPSFLFHRTIPYESDETRISIAFDLVPR